MVGKRIKALHKSQKLTQVELSDSINIGQSALANFENGKRSLPIDILIKFAQYFDVSTDYLLGLTENPDSKITVHSEQLPEDEKKLLETYRCLTSDEKQVVLGKALDLKLFSSPLFYIIIYH